MSGITNPGLSRRAIPAFVAALGIVLSTIAAAPAARATTDPASGNTGISGSGASTGTQDEAATQLNGGPPCATVTLPGDRSILNLQDTGGYIAVSGSTSSVYNGNSSATITATQSFSISPAGTYANSSCAGAPGPIAVSAKMTAPNGALDCLAAGTLIRVNTNVVINVSGPCTVRGNAAGYTATITDPTVTHIFNGNLLPCGIAPCQPPVTDFSGTYHASGILPGVPASIGGGLPSGTAHGFGGNSTGQLGDGTTTSRSTPAPVTGLGPVTGVSTTTSAAHSLGGHSLAVLADGTVWAWGLNGSGELGTGATSTSPALTPQRVLLPADPRNPFIAVASGGYDDINLQHPPAPGGASLALRADGTVWAWGDNICGRLGDGTTATRATPRQVLDPADRTKPLAHVTAIAAGDGHSVALRDDGTVWAWGDDTHGELGNGSTAFIPLPTTGAAIFWYPACSPPAVSQVNLGGKRAVAIAANAHKGLAVLEDHSVQQWGGFDLGAYRNNAVTPTPVPVPGLQGKTFHAVAAGVIHDLALADDGTVWSWGSNPKGQLGSGSPTGDPTSTGGGYFPPKQVIDPADINRPLSGVTAIAAGGSHSLALRADGTLWGWGEDDLGQIGQPGNADINPLPSQVPGVRADGLAAGAVDSLAMVVGPVVPGPRFSGDAATVYLQGVSLGQGAQAIADGGQGICEARLDSASAASVTRTTNGLPVCNLDGLPLLRAAVATNTVTATGNAANGGTTAHSSVASLTLLPGMGTSGADVLDVTGLDSQASASCTGGASGTPSAYSSIARTNLMINGTRIETKPVGDKIYFNPTGSNQKVLYGNPIWVNPLGAKVPMAIVTLNYSSYDPASNSQVSSPIAVEFPAGGPLASVVVGKVFLSYAQAGISGCRA